MSQTTNDIDSWFTSRREKRLWIWTLVIVLGIYSTLGLASTLAKWLNQQGLAATVFVSCMVLVLATIILIGLKTRPRGIEIGVGIGILVVYVMVLLRLTIPERSHLIEYSVVAAFVYEALSERSLHGRRVALLPLLALLITSLIGVVDEVIQYFLPNRVFDWIDIVFNCLAALMSVVALTVLRWVRRRLSSYAEFDDENS